MKHTSRVFVAGHAGLVGSAIAQKLRSDDFDDVIVQSHDDLDLARTREVDAFFAQRRPEYVFLAAALVGGIHANSTRGGEFIRDNLLIQTNVIEACRRFGVKKLLFLGSSCIYPRLAEQPIREDALLTGPLEPTNEPYAVAKIAGITMCRAYRRQYGLRSVCLMPANLYGPNDRFDTDDSHVLPALIRKFHAAKAEGADHVTLWGSGTARREFLHVDDLAAAAVMAMQSDAELDLLNVGTGREISIRELARLVAQAAGFAGEVRFDVSRPDGTPRKLLDSSRIAGLGWRPTIDLEAGIRRTTAEFAARAGFCGGPCAEAIKPASGIDR
jgi:GDP-L-fucose synthase